MTNATKITAQPGVPFIDIEREYDAPRELVYRAHIDPDLIVKWLGPNGYKMEVKEFDVRDGGTYAYLHQDPEGNEYGFRGVVHSATAPERIIQTFEYEGAPGFVSLESMTFEDLGDRTRCVAHSVFPSVQARDDMIESGMETGVVEGNERLDEVLATLNS